MGRIHRREARCLPILAIALCLAPGAHAADQALVDEGRYVATAAGCEACHTADESKPYAGGHTLQTPFGELVTPNITQDRDTGIGTWDKAAFESALHKGVDNEGSPLYPAMPYMHYTKMTDADLDALWAFVQTLEPVSNEVEVNKLPFPFDVRQSLYAWRALYFREGRFEPNGDKSDDWNRGAYLVSALGHCGACHTPRDPLGGPISSRELQGGKIEEWYAPDISGDADSVIADWDVDRLAGFLAGHDGMNHVAVGQMSDVVRELSQLREADVRAIAVYLKDQPVGEDVDARRSEPPVSAATREVWASLFENHCVTCHGANGEGAPGVAASLVGSGAVLADQPNNVVSVLLEGIAPKGDYGAMPSFRDALTNEEVAALADYVRTSWGNDAPANATADLVAYLRNATTSDPGAVAAATCPNVPEAAVDDETRSALSKLAQNATLDNDMVAGVVESYASAHPDATVTDRVVHLGGVFCQDVAESGAAKSVVMARQLAFMNAVLAITSTR